MGMWTPSRVPESSAPVFQERNHGTVLRTQTHCLLWAAHIQEDIDPVVQIEAGEDGVFRSRISIPSALLPQYVEFCEILGLHVWLLAALRNTFERSTRRSRAGDGELDAVLIQLGHVWNPTAHLPRELRWLWAALDEEAQLGWEWQSTLTRVRDTVTLLTRKAIEETLHASGL